MRDHDGQLQSLNLLNLIWLFGQVERKKNTRIRQVKNPDPHQTEIQFIVRKSAGFTRRKRRISAWWMRKRDPLRKPRPKTTAPNENLAASQENYKSL